jgi:hypothetical protein
VSLGAKWNIRRNTLRYSPYALKELDAAIKRRGFAEAALMSK